MKFLYTILSVFIAVSTLCQAEPVQNPQEALKKLIAGNKRYMEDKLEHPNRSQMRREGLVASQNPFVTIVGCSDSRIPPEIVFDQGVGDIFVVRVAGNVVSAIELESVNYSADHLGASLVLVLGHENCGAVNAVYKDQTDDIPTIAKLIEPAIQEVRKTSHDNLESVIKANVTAGVKYLRSTPTLKQLIAEKKIDVIGGYYHLQSGEVEICCPGEWTTK